MTSKPLTILILLCNVSSAFFIEMNMSLHTEFRSDRPNVKKNQQKIDIVCAAQKRVPNRCFFTLQENVRDVSMIIDFGFR